MAIGLVHNLHDQAELCYMYGTLPKILEPFEDPHKYSAGTQCENSALQRLIIKHTFDRNASCPTWTSNVMSAAHGTAQLFYTRIAVSLCC